LFYSLVMELFPFLDFYLLVLAYSLVMELFPFLDFHIFILF